MANRTAKDAATVKGTNPQFLVEKIIRQRIYDSLFWKEHCFALTGTVDGRHIELSDITVMWLLVSTIYIIAAELIVDKGMELRYVGGIYAGNIKVPGYILNFRTNFRTNGMPTGELKTWKCWSRNVNGSKLFLICLEMFCLGIGTSLYFNAKITTNDCYAACWSYEKGGAWMWLVLDFCTCAWNIKIGGLDFESNLSSSH